jgi:hypothetical protein
MTRPRATRATDPSRVRARHDQVALGGERGRAARASRRIARKRTDPPQKETDDPDRLSELRLPAQTVDRFALNATSGPVEHVNTRRVTGHALTPLVEHREPRGARPLGHGGETSGASALLQGARPHDDETRTELSAARRGAARAGRDAALRRSPGRSASCPRSRAPPAASQRPAPAAPARTARRSSRRSAWPPTRTARVSTSPRPRQTRSPSSSASRRPAR